MNVPIDISNVILHTKRLTLRPWTQDDASDLYEYAKVPGVGEMADWKHHESLEESKKIVDMFIQGKKTFAIVYNNKVIGSIGIEKYNEEKLPEFQNLKVRELGYVLSKDYWGQGFTPEAVKAVIHYLFDELQLDLLTCGNFDWNRQSARVKEKCGFTYYKTFSYTTQMNTPETSILSVLYHPNL